MTQWVRLGQRLQLWLRFDLWPKERGWGWGAVGAGVEGRLSLCLCSFRPEVPTSSCFPLPLSPFLPCCIRVSRNLTCLRGEWARPGRSWISGWGPGRMGAEGPGPPVSGLNKRVGRGV